MAENIWQKGKLQMVFYPVGKRANGEPRYQRAPYDILYWDPTGTSGEQVFVVPVGSESVNSASVARSALIEGQERSEFGFYAKEPIFWEPHRSDGKDDTVMSVHSFGNI